MKVQVTAAAVAAMCLPGGAAAQELDYRLPQTTMVAAWQARITHCPDRDDSEVRYTADVAVAGAASAGELVRLNPSSPFLGSRKVTLTFNENGTLKTINAEGQGEGGTILASLVKTAAGFAALGVPVPALVPMAIPNAPPPPPPHVVCKPEIAKSVKRWSEVGDTIDAIEADVAAGKPLGAARASMLAELKKEQADLEEDLTLTTGVKLRRTRAQALALPGTGGGYLENQALDPIDLAEWLDADAGYSLPTPKVGRYGFCARFSATQAGFDASAPVGTPSLAAWRAKHVDGGALRRERLDRFVYLSPVPVTIELFARAKAGGDCAKDDVRGKKLAGKPVMVAQLSDYFILPIGSGAFESKATSAEFADDGRIVSIGTNNTGGGTQFAEALAGALAGAETVQGAGTAAIQRRIDRIKAENELRDLLDKSEEK